MRNRASCLLGALLISVYFLVSAADGLRAGFTTDDLVNLSGYWSQPVPALVKANVLYFSASYRPMGALFYRPLFALAGLRPLPYRVFCFLFLLTNLWLTYLTIRLVTHSREIAALTTLIGSFHARFVDLYWNSGTIYDILCFTFYFGALSYYVRARRDGPVRGLRRSVIFLALYIGALDSKEMAVTLPVLVILYELIYFPPSAFGIRELTRWTMTNSRLALTAGVMTAPYVWGKLRPESPFSQLARYHPNISLHQFLATYGAYLDALFYRDHWFSETQTALLLVSMLIPALLLRSRHVALAWSTVVVSILPIAFIPPRSGFALYIPMVGWSLYLTALLAWLRDRLISSQRSIGTIQLRQLFLFLLALVLLTRAHRIQRLRMGGEFTLLQPTIRSMIAQLDQLQPELPRGTRLLFINNPFPDDYGVLMLLRLYFRDHALELDHAAADDCRHDYVMVWRGGALLLFRPESSGRRPCAGPIL